MGAAADIPPASRPDHAAIAIFADVLFSYCEGWVAVRQFADKGNAKQGSRTPFFRADANLAQNITNEAQRAAESRLALYVVPGTVSGQGKAKADGTPPPVPVASKGRVLDHIGFEVKDLKAFIERLADDGQKLDMAYTDASSKLGLKIAFITDPWGTYIELNERPGQ